MAVTDVFHFLRAPALPGQAVLDEWLSRWRNALVVCLPPRVRRVFERQDQRLLVVPAGATATFYQQQGMDRRAVGELDSSDTGTLQAVVATLRGTNQRTIIELPAALVLKRHVSFPSQVRENLAKVLRYEIDRVTPFQADQVFFDFRVEDRAGPKDKLPVELVLCRRDHLQGWMRRLREAGAPAEQVTWEGAWPRANLLPPEERPKRGGGWFSATKILVVAALVLLGLALATPLWQKTRLVERLEAELATAKQEAEKVDEVRTALERAREGSVAVLQRKLDQARSVDLLRELTEVLPDDTWVQNLEFRDGEVQIRGESAQASALIGLLERAPGISEVSFRSPVVQVAAADKERFHISFKFTREQPK